MMSMQDAPGWYGKIGAVGDFASRRLDDVTIRTIDRWLSTVVAESQATLGSQWLSTYLHAPLWRFAWAPGVMDGRWWFGILMPSCDNVGRYFPLLLAHARIQAPQDRPALNHLQMWWQHLAESALSTLVEHTTLDAFEELLAESPPWPTSSMHQLPPGRIHQNMVTGRSSEVATLAPQTDLSEWLRERASHALAAELAGHSMWWQFDEEHGLTSMRLIQGLPDGAEFTALISMAE